MIAKSAASAARRVMKPQSSLGSSSYILVVDDDDNSRNAFQELLEAWGYDVETADSGQRALEIAQANYPPVAFIDLNMPGMSGHELAAQLRRVTPRPARLFAISANISQEAASRLFDGLFQKPIDPGLIWNILRASFPTRS